MQQISSTAQLRSWLPIGPFHARSVDEPRNNAQYGSVGSFYVVPEYGFQACPSAHFLGVDVLCAANPANHFAMPQVRTTISFGDRLVLRGYTLKHNALDLGIRMP